jgi:hypothetical protein
MDRDALKAIQNQKVFVPLSAVLEIQANFDRLRAQAHPIPQSTLQHLRGMASVIKSLGLPIDIPNGY